MTTTSSIPIPSRPATTYNPLEGFQSPQDLIFDMSPLFPEDTPILQFGGRLHENATIHPPLNPPPLLRSLVRPDSKTSCIREIEAHRPYKNEPFLYSFPKLPSRTTPLHSRSRTDHLARRSRRDSSSSDSREFRSSVLKRKTPSYSSQSSRRCSMSSSDMKRPTTVLTSAFQSSVSSGTTASGSSYSTPPSSEVIPPIPLPAVSPPVRTARARFPAAAKRRSSIGLSRPTSSAKLSRGCSPNILRAPTAAPVLSIPRIESRAGDSPVALSPVSPNHIRPPHVPVTRGRRSTIMRDRMVRLSDEEISETLKYSEKFGLEKFLPAAKANTKTKGGKDENATQEMIRIEEKERGRTLSRTRNTRR